MRRTFLRSKIHRATVTGTHLEYEGSLTVDPALLREADLLPCERVEVYNLESGARFATYVIPGAEGSGEIVVNGAAARLASAGDRIIVAAYADLEEFEWVSHRPRVVLVDARNRVVSRTDAIRAGTVVG